MNPGKNMRITLLLLPQPLPRQPLRKEKVTMQDALDLLTATRTLMMVMSKSPEFWLGNFNDLPQPRRWRE